MRDYRTIRRSIGSTERSPRAPSGAHPWIVGVAIAALWTAAVPPTVAAQSPTTAAVEEKATVVRGQEARGQTSVWPEGEWRFGGSLGFPGIRLQPVPGAFTLGAHAQYFPRGAVGVEGSLGLAPIGLMLGGLIMGGRAGFTVPVRANSILILPSAGASVLAGGSSNGFDAGPRFFYAGLATLNLEGLRAGVTLHWRHLSEAPAWLVEVGGIRLP